MDSTANMSPFGKLIGLTRIVEIFCEQAHVETGRGRRHFAFGPTDDFGAVAALTECQKERASCQFSEGPSSNCGVGGWQHWLGLWLRRTREAAAITKVILK